MKRVLLNKYALLIVSTALSLVIGTAAYRYATRPFKPVVYQGQNNDYALSFYSTNGQKITALNGNLKLRIDPFTIYANYPNQNTSSYSTNSAGFRNTYTRDPAPENVAIVLGGSAAFGYGLPSDNDTFVSHIGRLNKKYRFANAGVVGFLSGQELSLMVHVLDQHNPSLYIAFDGWNDITDPYQRATQWPTIGGLINGFSQAFLMIEGRLESPQREQQSNKGLASELPSTRTTFEDEQSYFEAIVSLYTANLGKMHAFAGARKARYVVAFQPELGSKRVRTSDEQKMLEQLDAEYKYVSRNVPDKYRQLILRAKSFCDQNGIPYIDVNDHPMFADNPNTLFYDVAHPNGEGHRIIAEIINQVLMEKF
jgi:lysophospholipase L1-like esterase